MERDVLRCGVAVNRWVPDERGRRVWVFLKIASRSSRENVYADVAQRTYSMMREVSCPRWYRRLCELTIKNGMSQEDPRRVVIGIGIWEEMFVLPAEKQEDGK